MSDTGPTNNVPLRGNASQSGQITSRSDASAAREPNARLVGVPNEVRAQVQNTKRAIKIRGEVVRNNDDGSVRVRTPRGDIDVRPRENAPRPQTGQAVDIEIAPPRSGQSAPQDANIRVVRSDAAPARSSGTPVDVRVSGDTQPAQPPQAKLPPELRHATPKPYGTLPPEGSTVRLQPVTPATLASLPPQPIIQSVAATITQSANFQAQIIASNAVSDTAAPLLNIPRAEITQAAPQITPTLAQPQTAPLFTAPPVASAPFTPSANTVQITPPTLAAPAAVATNLNVLPAGPVQITASQNTIQTTAPALLPSTPAAIATLNPATPGTAPVPTPQTLSITPKPLNVRIDAITPPPTFLAAPNALSAASGPNAPAPIPGTQNIAADLNALQNAPNPILNTPKAGSLVGVVTAVSDGQLPILTVLFPQSTASGALTSGAFESQFFALQSPTDGITPGTQIHVTPQSTLSSLSQPATLMPFQNLITPQPWPMMEDVFQSLARITPQTAQAMLAMTPSPSSPAQLGPAATFFIAALRGGDLTQWLGDKAVDALKSKGRTGLLSRIMGESSTLSRVASEPLSQDWKALNLPMLWEGDIQKIALFYKHEYDDSADPNEDKPKGTRFVFDLALDKMGQVQLDGLFRTDRLDVVVRTEENFSDNTRAEMRRIYARALRDTGVTGELSFQNNPESWVTVKSEAEKQLGVSA